MRALFGSPSQALALLLCATLTLAPSGAAMGGEQKCSSAKTADELIECDHCYQLKALLNTDSKVDMDISVYDLAHGVLIDLSARDDAGMEFVHKVVAELWGMEAAETASTRVANYCEFCEGRSKSLQSLDRDRAFTDDGAIVILTSDVDELVQWSRQDAQWVRGVLQRATSSH